MKKDTHFSEEQLNAFVDGELDPEERSRFYNEAEHSDELDRRLCQQRKLKELVRHAYDDVPAPRNPARTPLPRSAFFGRVLAAGVLLALGLSAGLVTHRYLDEAAAGGDAQPVAAIENYILHVASGEPEQMGAALEKARSLLDSAPAGQPRQVEIVANERGIDLLRSDVTPFAREIRALADSDVVFYACSRTIQRLQERGVEVRIVPEANVEYTALDRVVSRMQDGWNYVKI
jgi:intracellular sulfur oxidation DsrE/DsrF family protein